MTEPNYELLREAYAIIGGIPARLFDLDSIVSKHGPSPSCGTIACAGGWLAMHPKFQDIGLSLEPRHGYTGLAFKGESDYFEDVLARVFNISVQDAGELFGTNGWSDYDHRISTNISHKKRWMARVRMYLEERGQLTSQLETAAA